MNVSCLNKWSKGRSQSGLPSQLLKAKHIGSTDVITTQNGAQFAAYRKCEVNVALGYKLYLLIPNSETLTEVSGDLMRTAGNSCPKNSVGDGSFVEVKSKNKIKSGQQAFLLVGKPSDILGLRLVTEEFQKTKLQICQKPNYKTEFYRLKNNSLIYFSQTTDKCDWQFFGLAKDSTCTVLGKKILDCPAAGPTAQGMYGTPQRKLTLSLHEKSEIFIQTDSSIWEYYGSSISRIEGNKFIESRKVFSDECISH